MGVFAYTAKTADGKKVESVIRASNKGAAQAELKKKNLTVATLTEQKVTKLIHLIEELRADLPGVRMRHDPHVSQLKKPTDPAQVASALKEHGPSSDAAEPNPHPE